MTGPTQLTIRNVTVDCHDPARVAAFWAAALGREVDPGGNPYLASIGHHAGPDSPDGSEGAGAGAGAGQAAEPAWLFLAVPEGKTAKNRLHLDFGVSDRAAAVTRLVGLGATHVADKDEWGMRWTVLQDVEGNEFCIAETCSLT